MIWIGVERGGGGAWLPPTYLKYTWELWKELSGRSLEQMLGVGSKVNNVGLAGGLIRLSTDFTYYEKVWKLGERRGRLFWFCKHVLLPKCQTMNFVEETKSEKIHADFHPQVRNEHHIWHEQWQRTQNAGQLSRCHAVTTSWLNAGGVEGWIDWNLCLDERGQSMDASDASQIWLQ